MKNLWNDSEASNYQDDLALRVYTSRLLGQEPALVLHGGGNTSVKSNATNIFGESEELLYVKGSGWDLATIEPAGFAPVKLSVLKKLAELPELSDLDMVQTQRSAMINPSAPNPSVEAILHAIIPFKYVDHTHADAVVTITNTASGMERIQQIYGNRVLIVPYVMPGFVLAKQVYDMTKNIDWNQLEGMVLMNHGVFTFADDAKTSYTNMIKLVTEAENNLPKNNPINNVTSEIDLLELAKLRKNISTVKGCAVVAKLNSDAACFSQRDNIDSIATRGPLTPDHVIRTKRIPFIVGTKIEDYVKEYKEYFSRNTDGKLTCLNPAPCWAVWPQVGLVNFGRSYKEAGIIADITKHTIHAIEIAEDLEGWQALPEADIFAVEYWELEQAKLGKKTSSLPLQGKVALVTGAASGIGKACVEELHAQGAAVVAVDINPIVTEQQADILGIVCDITKDIQNVVETTVRKFGGLDILISNAGTFPSSAKISEMNSDTWDASMAINLTSHQRLLTACSPYLKVGIDAAVVMIASKNVPAPGPGAAAYSVAKAGQTQLARIAALELGEAGVRVNVLHPNAVFDTGIWTNEILTKRAEHYGVTVEEYKTNNILRTEITSKDVANLACAMVGPIFAKTTGAQIPIDGGNERVI
ncbi:bifunctional aldolase/short-chain dehydrogenase [Candidatus Halobeggiatoa sp. HSG11]|nr:bifunctional aldolase/short-chain dehydrogenase [Candidatus Halobeggiatoa sp. HSG11]